MNELSVLISKTRDVIPEAIQQASVSTVGVVVDASPKFSGQLRASTRLGFNSPDLTVVIAPVYAFGAVSGAEQISKGRAAAVASRYKQGDTIYISNDLPYAWTQEREAGHLMFAKAAAAFPQLLDEAINAAQ